MDGYIYCLSNKSYENIYKIGYTNRNPYIRCNELYTTGVLHCFKLEFAKKVYNVKEKEMYIHEILSQFRVNKDREFFEFPLEKIRKLFCIINGTWFNINNIIKENKNIIENKNDKF